MNAKRILEAHPDAPVSLLYLDRDGSEALACFPSFVVAMQALCYDTGVRRVLAMTVHAADTSLALAGRDLDRLVEALHARGGDGMPNGDGFSTLMGLADRVATLARRLGPARPLAVHIDGLR